MAFKRLSKDSAAKAKNTTPAKKRGTGNYNILKFGKSTLDKAPAGKPFAYNISIQFNEGSSYDEDGAEYSKLATVLEVISGLASEKSGKRRGANFYFFNNDDQEKSNSTAAFVGSARFDIKLSERDRVSQKRNEDNIKSALVELQKNPDLFEGEKNYIKVANIFLDEARRGDSYEFKSRALLYSRPVEVPGLAEFDLDTVAALTVARCMTKPIYGAIFENNNGYGGSLSFAIDQELYESVCNLCESLGLLTDAEEDEDDFPPY